MKEVSKAKKGTFSSRWSNINLQSEGRRGGQGMTSNQIRLEQDGKKHIGKG